MQSTGRGWMRASLLVTLAILGSLALAMSVSSPAQSQDRRFDLMLILTPEGEPFALDVEVGLPLLRQGVDLTSAGESRFRAFTVLWEDFLYLSADGSLNPDTGDVEGVIRGEYSHSGGVNFQLGLIQGSLDKCYEQRDYMRRTFNDPSYPWDCSSQEARWDQANAMPQGYQPVSEISGRWIGRIDETGAGTGSWSFTVQGFTDSYTPHTFNEKTYSGTLVIESGEGWEWYTPTEIPAQSGGQPDSPGDSDGQPASSQGSQPGASSTSGTSESIPAAAWGGSVIGVLGGGAFILALYSGFSGRFSFFPTQRPDPGNVAVVNDGHGLRAVGTVGGFATPGPKITPARAGQKIGPGVEEAQDRAAEALTPPENLAGLKAMGEKPILVDIEKMTEDEMRRKLRETFGDK